MSAPFCQKDVKIASKWKVLLVRIFGKKIADKRQYGTTIYSYKGVFYVTGWLPEVVRKN